MKKQLVLAVAALVLVLSSLALAKEHEEATAGPAQPAVLLATAAPQALRVTFDDGGFNYYSKDEGFIHLSSDASGLVLHLTAENNPHGTRHIFDEVDKLSRKEHNRIYQEADYRESFVEQRRVQAKEEARLQKLVNVTQRPGEVTVTHQWAYLEPVLSYYLAELAALGFEAQPELQVANIRAYTVSDGARQAKVTFTRHGNNIRVRIAGSAY